MHTFESAIAGSDVVFIVGTGVSAAISDGASTATWLGLIRDGIERVTSLKNDGGSTWSALVSDLLKYGEETGNNSYFIQAAGIVATELKSVGQKEFDRWLQERVGDLPIVNREPALALLSYPFPILTTNYDTLLEQVGSRPSAYWTDTGPFQSVLTRDSSAIGHIHGVWNRSESVVLTESDYARLTQHKSTMALEHAVSALKSIVYVGFGSGLADPNFSELLRWQRETLPESPVVHFRLCKSGEERDIRLTHGNDNVVPVVYGDSYSDLAPFLRRHLPSKGTLVVNEVGLARDVVHEARNELQESMSADSVLSEAGVDRENVGALIVPPVLLPMPHAMYVRERMRSTSGEDMAPYDAYVEAATQDIMVVVGDEGSGITTAVKWLAFEASKALGAAAPIYVNFTNCHGKKPLLSAVTRAAMGLGLIQDRKSALPAHVLALDDYNPSARAVTAAVLDEFITSDALRKVMGCRQGDEEEVLSRLRSAGLNPRVHYLGRMRTDDVRALADVISPGQGLKIATEVRRVLNIEGLHKTPLTVSILIYLVHRGVSDPGSQTSIIDSYVHLLLVIGDPHVSRPNLSEGDLEAILANLAEYMTWEERSVVPESEAVRAIAGVIQKYGWPAQATEVLAYLKARRILRVDGGSVSFARTSYFYIFAARRAVSDKEFFDLIANDPFYYEPVVTRYAALVKTNADLLDFIEPVVDASLAETVQALTPYEILPLVEVGQEPADEGSVEDAAAVGSSDVVAVDRSTATSSEMVELELPEFNGSVSFGLVRSEMSVERRLKRSLRLVSTVLRDLDQVENLETKEQMLVNVLELWGRYITALNADPAVEAFRQSLREYFLETGDDNERDRDAIEYFTTGFPASSTMGAMGSSLVSSKLVPTFMNALAGGQLALSEERRTASIFFLLLQTPPGWSSAIRTLIEGAEPTWILKHFVHDICWSRYVGSAEEQPDLLRLCQALDHLGKTYASPKVRGAHASSYERQAKVARAKYAARHGKSPAAIT